MQLLTIFLAIDGFLVGLLVSLAWFKAGQVGVVLARGKGDPVNQIQFQASWIAVILTARSKPAD